MTSKSKVFKYGIESGYFIDKLFQYFEYIEHLLIALFHSSHALFDSNLNN